jgi:hypothetical protein
VKHKYIIENTALTYILESIPHKLIEDVWNKFNEYCDCDKIISDKETKKLLTKELVEEESLLWIEEHSSMFKGITQKEAQELGELVDLGFFNDYDTSMEIVRKLPISIPFIIAMAIVQGRRIIIGKTCKDRKKIHEICKNIKADCNIKIECIDIEVYLVMIKDGQA